MIKFHIPISVKSNFEGYSFFGQVCQRVKGFENEKISFDFSDCTWFEANLCAVLGSITNELEKVNNKISLDNIGEKQINVFKANGFFSDEKEIRSNAQNGTTVSFKKFKISDEKLIKNYIGRELLDKPDMPLISVGLKNEIIRSIFEIYSNAITHGECIYVFSCGQYFPNKRIPEMNFTIVDLGKTIKHQVSVYLSEGKSGLDSIIWALKEGNTTKTGQQPGGLGLSLIQEFITKNNGKIQIISSEGYWELVRGKVQSENMNFEFEGTIVNLVFNLSDTNQYILRSEVNTDVLF